MALSTKYQSNQINKIHITGYNLKVSSFISNGLQILKDVHEEYTNIITLQNAQQDRINEKT